MPTMIASVPVQAVDCIIVGGGPAGLTAATYLRRFHRSVIVFDDGRSRARWIPKTHNCPGFPHGVSGAELLTRLRQQATEYGAQIQSSTITTLQQIQDRWQASDGQQMWAAAQIILATGVEDQLPPITGDYARAIEAGLLRMCAICDGFEATDKAIAVIGPLDKALAHACFLRTFSARVSVVPTDIASAAPTHLLSERLQQAQTLHIPITPALAQLSFQDGACQIIDQQGQHHVFDTVYVALGSPGRISLAEQAGVTIHQGEIVTDAHLRTNVASVYAVGDVVTDLNQISVAFGHAAIAATSAHRALPPSPRQ